MLLRKWSEPNMQETHETSTMPLTAAARKFSVPRITLSGMRISGKVRFGAKNWSSNCTYTTDDVCVCVWGGGGGGGERGGREGGFWFNAYIDYMAQRGSFIVYKHCDDKIIVGDDFRTHVI